MITNIFSTLILASVLMSNIYAAEVCPKNKDVKKVAKDLIEIEVSGIRLIVGAKEKCLNKKFPEYRFGKDPDYDAPKNLQYIMDSPESIKITAIESADKEVHAYRAKFSANVMDLKGKKRVIKDQILFYLNTSERAQKSDGCAAVLEGMKNLVILKSCKE